MKRSPSKEKSSEVVAENLEMTTKVDGGNNASKDETPQSKVLFINNTTIKIKICVFFAK